MRDLKKRIVEYRVDTNEDCKILIEQIEEESEGVVTHKTTYKKPTKTKDEFWIVTITEDFSANLD